MNPLGRPEFQLFLAVLGTLLVTWPIVALQRPASVFIGIFATWGLLIVVLFFVSRHVGGDEETEPERDADV